MLSVWLTESEEAASTPTPNTVVYLGKLDTGLVCRGHLTRLELEPGHKYNHHLRYHMSGYNKSLPVPVLQIEDFNVKLEK